MFNLSFCASGLLLFATTIAYSATVSVSARPNWTRRNAPTPCQPVVSDRRRGQSRHCRREPCLPRHSRDARCCPHRTDKDRPLVVLSHGYGGSWRNLDWLAGELAGRGYIVAGPDHPGTTTFNKDPSQAATLWERPRDLGRIIDALAAEPTLAGSIDVNRIAAIGHSLGGWTVAALAGARFDTALLARDCQTNSSPRACSLKAELGLGQAELEISGRSATWRVCDSRSRSGERLFIGKPECRSAHQLL